MRFTFRAKLLIGFVISVYVMISSGDFRQAMTLLSVSRNLGIPGTGASGWAILFSGFVVGPLFVAIMISIAIWLFRVLLTTLGLKASPQKRSPKFATRAQKQKQMEDNEIVDAEWTEVHGIENRGQ